jgi:hypothetical protein
MKGEHRMLFNIRLQRVGAAVTLLSLMAMAIAGSAGGRWT